MSLNSLNSALQGFDPQWTCPIYARVFLAAPTLFGGASQAEIVNIASDISQVSGGAGLAILGVFMWPSDELPEGLQSLVDEIREGLIQYVPGSEYPVSRNA